MRHCLRFVNFKRSSLVLIFIFLCLFITGRTYAQRGFSEDFNDGYANNWIDNESGAWSVTNQVYRMTGNNADHYRSSYYDGSFSNFSYNVDIQKIRGRLASGNGMIFRYNLQKNSFYLFLISNDGQYVIYKYYGNKGYIIEPATASPHINTGLNAWNTLKVICNGSTIDFFVNDILLSTVDDPQPILSGLVGLIAYDEPKEGFFSDENAIVEFDNVKLTVIGP